MLKKIGLMVLFTTVSTVALANTLPDVLSYTYENSLTINADRAGLKATDETVAKAKSGYRPTVMGEGSIGRSYFKSVYDDNSAASMGQEVYQNPNAVGISFVQPIFSGLSTYHSVKAAKKQVESARSGLFNTEQVTLLEAVAVYMDVIRDRAVLDLQISNEKVLQQHLDSYRKRFNAGELTRTDVAQSEARLAGAKAARIAAEGNVKVSDANYFSVVGLEPEKQMADVNDTGIVLPQSLDEALKLSMENNPKIKAAKYAAEASKFTVSAKKGTLSPSVDVRANAAQYHESNLMDRNDVWQVTANLTVPFYQAGAEYADIRQAKQLENQYRILLAKIQQDVRSETISAWENYKATKAQISSIEAQIKASKIALDGVIREARVGSRTVLDVLDAEQEHLDNQVSLVKTHRDEIVAAYALLAAVGKLNPSDLNLTVSTYDPTVYYNQVKNKWFGYGTN